MKRNKIAILDWPSKSPDLIIVEHIWGIMKELVYKNNAISTKNELRSKIKAAAEEINANYKKSIQTMYKN